VGWHSFFDLACVEQDAKQGTSVALMGILNHSGRPDCHRTSEVKKKNEKQNKYQGDIYQKDIEMKEQVCANYQEESGSWHSIASLTL